MVWKLILLLQLQTPYGEVTPEMLDINTYSSERACKVAAKKIRWTPWVVAETDGNYRPWANVKNKRIIADCQKEKK